MKAYSWGEISAKAVGISCVIFVLLCIIFEPYAIWKWLGDNSGNLASWVQAIGSIGAIVGVFALSTMNANREKREKEISTMQDDYEMNHVALWAAARSHRLVKSMMTDENCARWVRNPIYAKQYKNRLKHHLEVMNTLISKNVKGELLAILLDYRGFLVIGIDAIDEFIQTPSAKTFETTVNMYKALNSLGSARAHLRIRLRAIRQKIDGAGLNSHVVTP